MKYSLRKSFGHHRQEDILDDDHVNPRVDQHGSSNSNSNLVKSNQSKSFLGRRRRYSASPPPPASPDKIKSKACEHPYNNHVNDEDEDDNDDPFSPSSSSTTRTRPFDKLTYQIRKSFRNTLTRRRSRLESNNSNKRLIFNKSTENHPASLITPPLSTGLTSPINLIPEAISTNEKDQMNTLPKRRKAPLAPTHINHSMTLPNKDFPALNVIEHQETSVASSSNDQQPNSSIKKTKFDRSFRTRISLLLKKRHAKQQQQQQQQQTQSCIDEDPDHHQTDDQDEMSPKKSTLGQRFDTLRRSLQLGNRNSISKGKRHLLANE